MPGFQRYDRVAESMKPYLIEEFAPEVITVLRTDGSPVGVLHAGARASFGLLLPLIWLAGMFPTVLDSRRRARHGLLSGTVVRRV